MKTDLFSLPTPFTPPTTEEDELSVLRLIRSRRVGPATFKRLIHEQGSARAALAALPEIARAAGVSGYEICPEGVAMAELRAGQRAGAQLLCYGGAGYPPELIDLPDPPAVLWALGDLSLLQKPRLALVGARNASSLGGRMTRALAHDLGAAGYAIVSGLARGIDAMAHEAALETGTIGVQAGGIDVIYPLENTALAEKMATRGLRLAENPPGTQPQARHFPQRNRIISGLAQAVIVVEAALRSGSLITARAALEQGREVMAVPGHPFDGRAGGCNALIRDGALLVRGAEDVLAGLGGPPARVPPPRIPQGDSAPPKSAPTLQPQHSEQPLALRLLSLLGPSPSTEDQLIRDLGADPAAVARTLLALELDGQVQRHPGGLLSRS
ncbi:DNA-processing protein DprA [Pseudothioclava arenosa]|uniref:DNA-protecting protein DprA n=1 Tax=Pseudothioclava arenosa TaxID=1795308 RepID=A0A2A4CTM5_9RHOB|nr:DNA-processing protein DprA [Pseudothioclava arenosa]PCD77847.1 DNA-protecting protein DprA [Pseudothioclava arenosa]